MALSNLIAHNRLVEGIQSTGLVSALRFSATPNPLEPQAGSFTAVDSYMLWAKGFYLSVRLFIRFNVVLYFGDRMVMVYSGIYRGTSVKLGLQDFVCVPREIVGQQMIVIKLKSEMK